MKEVVLKRIEPSERLKSLVDKIEFLRFEAGRIFNENDDWIYDTITSNINFVANNENYKNYYEKNRLLNKIKLSNAIVSKIYHVSQDQFTDLLEEHIYLEAKQKMEKLLPQIKEWYPEATLFDQTSHFAIHEKKDQHSDIIITYHYVYNPTITDIRKKEIFVIDGTNIKVKKHNQMPEIRIGDRIDDKNMTVYAKEKNFIYCIVPIDEEGFNKEKEKVSGKVYVEQSINLSFEKSRINKIFDRDTENLIWEKK